MVKSIQMICMLVGHENDFDFQQNSIDLVLLAPKMIVQLLVSPRSAINKNGPFVYKQKVGAHISRMCCSPATCTQKEKLGFRNYLLNRRIFNLKFRIFASKLFDIFELYIFLAFNFDLILIELLVYKVLVKSLESYFSKSGQLFFMSNFIPQKLFIEIIWGKL